MAAAWLLSKSDDDESDRAGTMSISAIWSPGRNFNAYKIKIQIIIKSCKENMTFDVILTFTPLEVLPVACRSDSEKRIANPSFVEINT
jgi:hypothetical protein